MRKRNEARDPRFDGLVEHVEALEQRVSLHGDSLAALDRVLAGLQSETGAMSALFVGLLGSYTDFALDAELERRRALREEAQGTDDVPEPGEAGERPAE